MNMSYLISFGSRITLSLLRKHALCGFLVFSTVFWTRALSNGQKLSRVILYVTLYIKGQ